MCVPVFRITSNSGSGLFVQQLAEINNIWKIKAPNSRPIVHGNLSVTNGFSSQSASDVESVSISWHRHGMEKLAFFMIAISPYIGYWQGSLFLFIVYHISYRRKFGLIAIKQTKKQTLLWKMTRYDIMKPIENINILLPEPCNIFWLYINSTDVFKEPSDISRIMSPYL